MIRAAGVLAIVLLSSCVHRVFSLPQPDRGVYARCEQVLVVAQCGTWRNGVCVGMMRNAYVAEPSLEDRRRWLVANGCPPSMVYPERYSAR